MTTIHESHQPCSTVLAEHEIGSAVQDLLQYRKWAEPFHFQALTGDESTASFARFEKWLRALDGIAFGFIYIREVMVLESILPPLKNEVAAKNGFLGYLTAKKKYKPLTPAETNRRLGLWAKWKIEERVPWKLEEIVDLIFELQAELGLSESIGIGETLLLLEQLI